MKHPIHKKGSYMEWLLPEKMYHGTTDKYLDSIIKEGLSIKHEQKNSALSLPMIYMTTSIEMAKEFAKSVSHRNGGNPIIVEIDSNNLEADSIGFDLNISLKLCSQCVTYQKTIEKIKIIKELENIKHSQMLFDEPDNIEIPVVWNLKEEKTLYYLESIGYKLNQEKKLKRKM